MKVSLVLRKPRGWCVPLLGCGFWGQVHTRVGDVDFSERTQHPMSLRQSLRSSSPPKLHLHQEAAVSHRAILGWMQRPLCTSVLLPFILGWVSNLPTSLKVSLPSDCAEPGRPGHQSSSRLCTAGGQAPALIPQIFLSAASKWPPVPTVVSEQEESVFFPGASSGTGFTAGHKT